MFQQGEPFTVIDTEAQIVFVASIQAFGSLRLHCVDSLRFTFHFDLVLFLLTE